MAAPTTINLVLGLINAAIPGIANIIALIRHKDGTMTVVQFLDEADPQIATNLKQIADWQAAHSVATHAAPATNPPST